MARASLKERQAHQKKIQKKRDADWKKHLASVAERNKDNPRAIATKNRDKQRELQKAKKEGLKTPKKSTAASKARAKNVAIHGEKSIAAAEKRNKAFQEAKKKGTHRKKKLTNAEKLRQRRGK